MLINTKRQSLDEALSNMFTSTLYNKNALFYVHLITQMKIVMDENLPAPAGVGFHIDHYVLYINENKFKEYSLNDRIFILIHECLHILMFHVNRNNDKNKLLWNCACDCAINQLIKSLKIPETAIIPTNLLGKDSQNVPLLATTETYYELLKEEVCEQCGNKKDKSQDQEDSEDLENSSSNTCPSCGGEIREVFDSHDIWEPKDTDESLQKDVTKQMIEKSIEQTQKSQGNLPNEISDWLNIFSQNAQVDWKKVLKNLIGNKKIGKRPTIMRKNRRFPERVDLKGTTKDRNFDLVCLVDISGSMSTKEILEGLNEIHHICKQNNTSMKLIQIDAKVHKIEDFSSKTKLFERKGNGGTIMESGIKYLFENNIPHDGIIYISDMYIEDITKWEKQPKCRTIWLSTSGEIPHWNKWKKHLVLPLNTK